MGIFKSDPAAKLEKDAATQRKLRAGHADEVTKAEAKVRTANAAEAALLDDGAGEDDPALKAVRQDRSDAKAAIKSRNEAISRVDAKLAEIAAEVAKHERDKQANVYAVEAERRVGVLDARTRDLLNSIMAWIPAAEDVAELTLDASGLPLYGRKSLEELPPAVAMAIETVRGRIIPDVLHGDKPAVIAAKPALVPPAPEAEKRIAWLAVQPIRHLQDGQPKLTGRYSIVMLTAEQSRMGLEGFDQKIICPLDDPRASDFRRKQASQQPPSEFHVYDLDAGTPPRGVTHVDLPSRAPKYTLPSNFAGSSNVDLPKVASRRVDDPGENK